MGDPAQVAADMTRIYKPEDQARRYSSSEELLKADGGKRVNVRLNGEAVDDMQTIMDDRECDQTRAIEHALAETATRIRNRRQKR